MAYTVTLTTKTEIEVTPTQRDIDAYGLIQAILEAGRVHPTYLAERDMEARIRSVCIDGEEITQF